MADQQPLLTTAAESLKTESSRSRVELPARLVKEKTVELVRELVGWATPFISRESVAHLDKLLCDYLTHLVQVIA
ncbi:MAG: hypothetical protein ACTHK7_16105 [Aureliella sp.]